MASVFDVVPPSGLPCGTGCEPQAAGGNETVYLSPQSDSIESAEFEVIGPAALVRGFNMPVGSRVSIEMVWGNCSDRIYGPYVKDGIELALTPTNTILSVPEPGRYRLVAHGVTLGVLMPTVVVNRRNGWTMPLS